jgi:hypothetical protein
MMDKMLIEFPVFGLNDDYMKALAIIIQSKVNHIKDSITDRLEELDILEHH